MIFKMWNYKLTQKINVEFIGDFSLLWFTDFVNKKKKRNRNDYMIKHPLEVRLG